MEMEGGRARQGRRSDSARRLRCGTRFCQGVGRRTVNTWATAANPAFCGVSAFPQTLSQSSSDIDGVQAEPGSDGAVGPPTSLRDSATKH